MWSTGKQAMLSKIDMDFKQGYEADFGVNVRNCVRSLWAELSDSFTFVNDMAGIIRRGYVNAWHEGATACGIQQSEFTDEERFAIEDAINSELVYLPGFASDVAKGTKSSGAKLGHWLRRAEMWTNRYSAIKSQAMTMACKDRKLMWSIDSVGCIEHCRDCLRLNNRVYRASTWRRYNIFPRMWALACKGRNCCCSFSPTTAPATKGRPPSIGR